MDQMSFPVILTFVVPILVVNLFSRLSNNHMTCYLWFHLQLHANQLMKVLLYNFFICLTLPSSMLKQHMSLF